MSHAERFAAFYEHVWGKPAFPWQRRLARDVLEHGWKRHLLDLPTGSGKTSALEIALYCLSVSPTTMPRRTLLVIDRRIVVDQAAEHAKKLLCRLCEATQGPAYEVATALRRLTGSDEGVAPFDVAIMRGGMPRDNDWAKTPDRPVLGVSTVDQVGSRLLFRGYGLGNKSAPIHAGLIGNDTLILLDEVHLATAFADTLDAINADFRGPERGLGDRFAVVPMSATVRAAKDRRVFTIEDDDRKHPVLQPRLEARKQARLEPIKVSGDDEQAKLAVVATRAAELARKLQERDGVNVVGVVLNRVDAARMAIAELARDGKGDAILVTGRMRPIDRDRTTAVELQRAAAGREARRSDLPLVVVATQCIEAGADLDFDAIVTECASLDALRQRFGRVDRRGELTQTYSIVLGRSDLVGADGTDPVYGKALGVTWHWLQGHAKDAIVEFGISTLPSDAPSEALPPTPIVPVLLPAHLDAWAQTSLPIVAEPDVSRWLHGAASSQADVQVVWRAGLAATNVDVLAAVRPSTLEGMTLPLRAVRKWLAGKRGPAISDVAIGEDEDDDRRDEAAATAVALRWTGESSKQISSTAIRPGDVLVVDVARGGIRHGSFDPTDVSTVIDVGDLAQLRGRGLATLRLERAALAMWNLAEDVLAELPTRDERETRREFLAKVSTWLERWPDERPTDLITQSEYNEMRRALRSGRARTIYVEPIWVISAPAKVLGEVSELVTEDDDSSFRAVEVTLDQHSHDVRERAREFARAVGLPVEVQDDVALAGWIHDVGKADPRFQRWLVGGDEVRAASQREALAKSALPPGDREVRRLARKRAGYPDRYRHELLSVAMMERNAELLACAHDPELVLHLVGSHHGWCRPFAPLADDPAPVEVAYQHGDLELVASSRHGLARLDRCVADRFWTLTRRYGWWGLAWLESIVRLADHRASEAAEVTR